MSRASTGNLALDQVTNRIEEEEVDLPVSRGDQLSLLQQSSLAAPVNFKVQSRNLTTANLSWVNNHGPLATGIEVERALGDGAFVLIDTIDPGDTTYLDTGLEPGTRYRYRLRVV